jgi:hypothetical protein
MNRGEPDFGFLLREGFLEGLSGILVHHGFTVHLGSSGHSSSSSRSSMPSQT